jgi:hypothetical protein
MLTIALSVVQRVAHVSIPTTIIEGSLKFEKNDRFNGDGDGG